MGTHAGRKDVRSSVQEILSAVVTGIGSIEFPDYRRIKLNANRYSNIVKDLSANFWIRDTSDENEDFSSVLLLRPLVGSADTYVIYVSNVANYAFLTKTGEHDDIPDDRAELINEIIRKYGLQLLSKDVLSTPVNAATFNADNPKLFNLLFSDTNFLPWEEPEKG